VSIVYQDDFTTILHGDSRQLIHDVVTDLGLEPAALVTDPPYGYAYASNMPTSSWKGEQIANDADTTARDDVLAAWGDRPALVFGSWKRDRPSGTRNVLVWDKGDSPGMGDLTLPWGYSHEEIYVLGEGFEGKRGGSVLRYQKIPPSERAGRWHPNEKPIPLMRDLIAKCPPGAVIVDAFMGSGSTLRAAKDLGRRAVGIELERKWCEVARSRLAQESLLV
jgi:hypothetical protein